MDHSVTGEVKREKCWQMISMSQLKVVQWLPMLAQTLAVQSKAEHRTSAKKAFAGALKG